MSRRALAHLYYLISNVLGDTKFLSFTVFVSFSKDWRFSVRPLARHPVSKGRSARRFKKQVSRTKAANMAINPMRGGWRL